jgi:hypothetical protein
MDLLGTEFQKPIFPGGVGKTYHCPLGSEFRGWCCVGTLVHQDHLRLGHVGRIFSSEQSSRCLKLQ